MDLRLPNDLETSIRAAVQGGRYASFEEAMTEAARLLVRALGSDPVKAQADASESPDPLLGLWHDYTYEMDEIVADAYRRRREEPWREFDL